MATRLSFSQKVVVLLITSIAATLCVCSYMLIMPNPAVQTVPDSEVEQAVADDLQLFVRTLAEDIGIRSLQSMEGLNRAEFFISSTLESFGYEVQKESVIDPDSGLESFNLIAELPGSIYPEEIVLLGAHYDSVGVGCPGANDNASGVAALLVLAKRLAQSKPIQTIRFVAFTNEEPPYFETPAMGSFVHAQNASARGEKISLMLSLETIGYFSEEVESQQYPLKALSYWYPSKGNFIAFVANLRSGLKLRKVLGVFRRAAHIPAEGIAAPAIVPGVSWSDHASFWRFGYPALMVTDTAPFRYPHYHRPTDTWEKLQYPKMARVVLGLEAALAQRL